MRLLANGLQRYIIYLLYNVYEGAFIVCALLKTKKVGIILRFPKNLRTFAAE
jgi:hypothetical protein